MNSSLFRSGANVCACTIIVKNRNVRLHYSICGDLWFGGFFFPLIPQGQPSATAIPPKVAAFFIVPIVVRFADSP